MLRVSILMFVTLAFLGGHKGRADEGADVAAQCRSLCREMPFTISVTLARSQGHWLIANLHCRFSGNRELTDSTLIPLKRLTGLEGLSFDASWDRRSECSRLTPAGYRILAALRLRRLGLPWAVRDSDVEAISSIAGLEELRFGRYAASGDAAQNAFVHVSRLRNLRRLTVGGEVPDASLQYLKPLQNLEQLHAASKDFGATAIASLGELKNLRSLTLSRLSAQSVAPLDRLPHLRELDVLTYETSPGTTTLSGLKTLERLRVAEVLFAPGTAIPLPENLRRIELCYPLTVSHKVVNGLDMGSARHIEHVTLDLPVPRGGPRDICDLQWLQLLPELKSVVLRNATDAEVKQLAALSSLKKVTLGGICEPSRRFGDEGMRALGELQRIESFEVVGYGSKMTDAGLNVLRKFTNLRRLTLLDCDKVTSKGLTVISKLGQLRALILDGSAVDLADDLLALASPLGELEELSVYIGNSHAMTDRGLRYVAALKKLRRLNLDISEGYRDTALASLMRELPNLESLEFTVP